jgi:hypothetical protein
MFRKVSAVTLIVHARLQIPPSVRRFSKNIYPAYTEIPCVA